MDYHDDDLIWFIIMMMRKSFTSSGTWTSTCLGTWLHYSLYWSSSGWGWYFPPTTKTIFSWSFEASFPGCTPCLKALPGRTPRAGFESKPRSLAVAQPAHSIQLHRRHNHHRHHRRHHHRRHHRNHHNLIIIFVLGDKQEPGWEPPANNSNQNV